MNRTLHLVRPQDNEVREPFARRYGILAVGLTASVVLHLALMAIDRAAAPREAPHSPSAIVARVAPITPAMEPRIAPEVPPPAAAHPPPTPSPRKAPAIAPALVPPPIATPTTAWVDVMVAHDTEPAIDAMFEETLSRDHPGAQRGALEFEVAPVVNLPAQVMSDSAQRMLRALVQITPKGDLDLVQTHEYDVPYMDAIRAALHAARAVPPPDGQVHWAILVFWFHRIGEVAPR